MKTIDPTLSDGREISALQTPTDLGQEGVKEITLTLHQLLADVFALYIKT
jgi:hypothetical protein